MYHPVFLELDLYVFETSHSLELEGPLADLGWVWALELVVVLVISHHRSIIHVTLYCTVLVRP